VQTLTGAGLVDLCHSAGTGLQESVPTKLGGAEFPAARLDYILATAPLADLTRDVHVIRDAGTDTASDHYPIVADVDLHAVIRPGRSQRRPRGRRQTARDRR
jgi:hypothetical protein